MSDDPQKPRVTLTADVAAYLAAMEEARRGR